MKLLHALPLLIITLGCSGMSVAEPEQYTLPENDSHHNERISQRHYDSITDEIEKQGYADILIMVDNSDYMQQVEKFIAKGGRSDEKEKARQDEILGKLKEKIQKRKEKAVEAIQTKLDKETKNGSRHFEITGGLNIRGSSFSARIWGHEAFEILITVEEVARIFGGYSVEFLWISPDSVDTQRLAFEAGSKA